MLTPARSGAACRRALLWGSHCSDQGEETEQGTRRSPAIHSAITAMMGFGHRSSGLNQIPRSLRCFWGSRQHSSSKG